MRVQDFMPINATPSRNVLHDARVSADYFQHIPRLQLFNFILGTDDRQGAKQAAGVEGFSRHVKPPLQSGEG